MFMDFEKMMLWLACELGKSWFVLLFKAELSGENSRQYDDKTKKKQLLLFLGEKVVQPSICVRVFENSMVMFWAVCFI